MLKTTSTAGPAASIEVGDENPEKGSQKVQIEDQGEKKPAQKNCKGQESQKTAKPKKLIHAKKVEAFKTRYFSSQSGVFFTTNAKRPFIKLRQAFIKALILNHFDLERHIQIETDALGYAIGRIFS